ncbi:unnamed protein product [Nyctereutes procyonoides]|uniref:(raccoon dog) hypothetical protein n=1 Tax=Nyctereutes procyonoides TaxID=34880 RepID=A0A811ZEF0_NYCPR|nr:unnamed protein product [Nyctereutes procyonoides]
MLLFIVMLMLMLSATQIYILTVQLFVFLNLLPTFDDLLARFGYRLPAESLRGFLINSKPENAYEPIGPPPLKDDSSGTFIVLIRRLLCNFDVEVLKAPRAGYKAATVHNSDDLNSVAPGDFNVLNKVDIPFLEFGVSLDIYYLNPLFIAVCICLVLIVLFMK